MHFSFGAQSFTPGLNGSDVLEKRWAKKTPNVTPLASRRNALIKELVSIFDSTTASFYAAHKRIIVPYGFSNEQLFHRNTKAFGKFLTICRMTKSLARVSYRNVTKKVNMAKLCIKERANKESSTMLERSFRKVTRDLFEKNNFEL